MKSGSTFKAYKDLHLLITTLEQQYGGSLHDHSTQDMIEACGGLSIAYSAIGNSELARKWAEQYLFHLAQVTGGSLFAQDDSAQVTKDTDDESEYT